jgi:hypothetical protein
MNERSRIANITLAAVVVGLVPAMAAGLLGCGDSGDPSGAGGSVNTTTTTTGASSGLDCYNTLEPALNACDSDDQTCIGSCSDATCSYGCSMTLCSCEDQAFANGQSCAASVGATGDEAFWGCLRSCFQGFCSCAFSCTDTTCVTQCLSTEEQCAMSCVKPTPYP